EAAGIPAPQRLAGEPSGDHAARRDHHAALDVRAVEHHAAGAEPHVALDHDAAARGHEALLAHDDVGALDRVVGGNERASRPDEHVVAEADPGARIEHA